MNNPYEYIQSFMNYDNFAKNMQSYTNMDVSSYSNTVKNTVDAINATNQLVSESFQSLVKRAAESMQKNTTEFYNTMREAISGGDVNQISSCQHKYMQSTFDNNINSAKEMIDISSKSSMEMLDLFRNVMKTTDKNLSSAAKVKKPA